MSWKIRHEGSPKSIEVQTPTQVLEGLRDGLWEPTDEVMGPQDRTWVALESHQVFAEAAAELEPPPAKEHDDETRLDMNPLIDVALVLLIFFILTTTYEAMAKVLEMPTTPDGIRVGQAADVINQAVVVQARMEGGQPVIYLVKSMTDREKIPVQDLEAKLKEIVTQTHKTEIVIDADKKVPWSVVMSIPDRAKGAGINKAHFVVPVPSGASTP